MVLVDYHEDDAFDGIQMRRLQLVDIEASLLEHSIMTMKSLNLINDLLEQTSQLFSTFLDSNEEFKAFTGVGERNRNSLAR